MQCQRCGKNEGEYFCSICNRVVCSDCKVIDNGKIYCLDDAPKGSTQNVASNVAQDAAQDVPQNVPQNVVQQEVKPPKSFKTLKELIYADLILLAGIAIIYYISTYLITNLIVSNSKILVENFPQLSFVFVLLGYFTSFGLIAILILFVLLIILIIIYLIKRQG